MTSIEEDGLPGKEVSEVDCIMGATLEIEKTVQDPLRAINPCKATEREAGRFLIRQFRVPPTKALTPSFI